MTEPDTQFGTNAGQSEPSIGQPKDTGQVAQSTREKDLERDLRELVSYGKDLTRSTCQRLRMLPRLEHVLLVAGQLPQDGKVSPTSPMTLRRVIRDAIDRLEQSEAESAPGYAQTRRLLFGQVKETRGLNTDRRWAKALDYYNQHVNFRKRPCENSNFRRRVYEGELLGPLVDCLLEWENDLARVPAMEFANKSLLHRWRSIYWALFRILDNVEAAADCASDYLAWKHERNHSLIWRAGEEVSGETDEERALRLMKMALFHIAVLNRFSRSEWTVRIRLELPPDVIGHLYEYLEEYFNFSERDQGWLDHELDEFAGSPAEASLLSQNEARDFVSAIDNDPRGSLIFRKFLALADMCSNCRIKQIVQFALERDALGFWLTLPERVCPLHALSLYAHWLEIELTRQWFDWTRAIGAWALRKSIPPLVPQ